LSFLKVACLTRQEILPKELHIYGWGNTKRDLNNLDRNGNAKGGQNTLLRIFDCEGINQHLGFGFGVYF
jgi:hypothetical protein